jgi:dTDP-L-rhamnose 4-epimerase
VDDAVEATWRCLQSHPAPVEAFNVGTGQRTTVREAAEDILEYYHNKTPVSITGTFRQGDIRHNFADLTKITRSMRFVPRFSFRNGLARFLDWASARSETLTGYQSSLKEMSERGFLHG